MDKSEFNNIIYAYAISKAIWAKLEDLDIMDNEMYDKNRMSFHLKRFFDGPLKTRFFKLLDLCWSLEKITAPYCCSNFPDDLGVNSNPDAQLLCDKIEKTLHTALCNIPKEEWPKLLSSGNDKDVKLVAEALRNCQENL